MNKILALLLLLSTQHVSAQLDFFFEDDISEELIILIGPKNVDRYFPSQSKIYTERYEYFSSLIEEEILIIEDKLVKIENKKIRNQNIIDEFKNQIERYYQELELLEEFIAHWSQHEENYIESRIKLNSIIDSLACYEILSNQVSYFENDLKIINLQKNETLRYYEFINSSYFTRDIIWDKIYQEKLVHKEIRDVLKKEENKKIRLTSMPTVKGESSQMSPDYIKLINSFQYDSKRREYFRELDVVLDNKVVQIINKDNNREVIPDEMIRLNCESKE